MKELFGTDGMRGEAGEFPLDAKTLAAAGRSLARRLRERLGREPRIVTGRDTRESGAWIESAFHAGAREAGAHVESADVITTPGVAFVTRAFGFDAGVVVSASHNPFHDNGIKIFAPTGKKLDAGTEREIEGDIYAEQGEEHPTTSEPDASRAEEYCNAYLDYLAEEFSELKLDGVRIVADCANGAASALAPRLLARFGAEVTAIHCAPDGRNINADCGSLHLDVVRDKVVETGADFGVAFDGDADRSLFVDDKGNLVDGDAVLWIMAQLLGDHGKLPGGLVVATVMSNIGLEIALESRNYKLLRTSVGDKYVLDELLKTGAAVGGEQSGHIIFPERSLVGDGMMTMLYLLEAVFEKKKSLSELTEGFVRYPQTLVNVRVGEKRPFEEVPAIADASRRVERELEGMGRLLLRYSGTENLARVMIEGKDQEAIERQAHELAEVIKSALSAG